MLDIFGLFLDLVLIGLLGIGISYAIKLTRQLADMRASRADMERFVIDFNASVMRAEAGIQGLKNTARSSGDDLEKLIERGHGLRDELLFLTESADQIAARLSTTASRASQNTRPAPSAAPPVKEPAKPSAKVASAVSALSSVSQEEPGLKVSSAAEQELMRVLKKLGSG